MMKDKGRQRIELSQRSPGGDEGEIAVALDQKGCGDAGSSPEPGHLLEVTGVKQRC